MSLLIEKKKEICYSKIEYKIEMGGHSEKVSKRFMGIGRSNYYYLCNLHDCLLIM